MFQVAPSARSLSRIWSRLTRNTRSVVAVRSPATWASPPSHAVATYPRPPDHAAYEHDPRRTGWVGLPETWSATVATWPEPRSTDRNDVGVSTSTADAS